ncbi:MAG: DUF402 domain-containing protein [Acidobacteriota bacterium]
MDATAATIRSLNYDRTIRKSWACELIEQFDQALTFMGVFDRDIDHAHLGLIACGTISYEYYWLDRWYNVFRFHEPNGQFRNFYCNISTPPTFRMGVLEYVDLDVDILVWRDGTVEILDREEYEENSIKYAIPPDVTNNVESAVAELLDAIARRQFPFDTNFG